MDSNARLEGSLNLLVLRFLMFMYNRYRLRKDNPNILDLLDVTVEHLYSANVT